MKRNVYLRQAHTASEGLRFSLRGGLLGLESLPRMIRKILQRGYWRERMLDDGTMVRNASFKDYITNPPLEGLGADPVMIKRLLWQQPRTLAMFERAMVGKQGVHRPRRKPTGEPNNVSPIQHGNSQAYTLRRLQRTRPDLLLKVEKGELSAHAAAKEAGFRKTLTPTQQILKLLPKVNDLQWQVVMRARKLLQQEQNTPEQQQRVIAMALRRLENQAR